MTGLRSPVLRFAGSGVAADVARIDALGNGVEP